MINTKRVSEYIQENLKDLLKVGFEDNKEYAKNYAKMMIELLISHPSFERKYFRYRAKINKESIEFTPLNLYTLLWMNHQFVDYKEIKDKNEYENQFGKWKFENGKSYFQFKRPIEYVKIETTLWKE